MSRPRKPGNVYYYDRYTNGEPPPKWDFDAKKYHREYQKSARARETRRKWLEAHPHYKRDKNRQYRFKNERDTGFISWWP
jgi:hypothetical protein